MNKELVITAVGPNRPGLVDELTKLLFDANVNLADSRMMNLRGQFAFMALVEVEENTAQAVSDQLADKGKSMGLSITVVPQIGTRGDITDGLHMRLKVYAMDQPGIAHRIAHLLSNRGINIEELETELHPGPYASRPHFAIELRMTMPVEVKVRQLRDELAQLCDSMNCDYDLDRG